MVSTLRLLIKIASVVGLARFLCKISGVGVVRAHLHIARQCRTEKPYETYGFGGFSKTPKRRNP